LRLEGGGQERNRRKKGAPDWELCGLGDCLDQWELRIFKNSVVCWTSVHSVELVISTEEGLRTESTGVSLIISVRIVYAVPYHPYRSEGNVSY
jgi:hypothetical protein